MYREKIDAYIDSKKEEMLADLSDLVRIDSTRGEAAEGKPFGEGPARVLAAAEELLEKCHMQVTNYDNYVVAGDYAGEGEKALDILAHLDVVPVTKSWTVTQPFAPKITDNRIYGRGTADDKGPAIAALYAVRAIHELGIPLKKGVRVILGSDEECGSHDLKYYYAREQEAEYTFTPDADYPLINLEKGRLASVFSRSFKGEETEGASLVRFDAGTAVNIVPAKAEAVIAGLGKGEIEAKAQRVTAETGVIFTAEETAEGILVTSAGVAAHGSTPELGKNAIVGLLVLIAELPLARSESTEAVAAILRLFPFGDTTGTALGAAMADEVSGALSMNLGILHISTEGVIGEYDSRCPICGTDENVTEVIRAALEKEGFSMEEEKMTPAHYVPEDSHFVQTLLGCYEDYFGQKGKPLSTGGGTYVHELERGVAFGCMIPEVDNHMHGDDEFMEIDMLIRSAKIFAQAIVRLCG